MLIAAGRNPLREKPKLFFVKLARMVSVHVGVIWKFFCHQGVQEI